MVDKKLLFNSLLFMMIALLSKINFAQSVPNSIKEKKPVPSNCEHIKHVLDYSLIEFSKTEDSYLIFVFRAGKGDYSGKFNKQRLNTIENYLKKRKIKFQQIIITEGKRNNGLGKTEIYLEGKLYDQLFFKSKENLKTVCADSP
jgi:hypothetical protein